MHTAKYEEEMILYSYGELEGEAKKAFEAHLAVCPDCAGRLAALKTAGAALRSNTVNPPNWLVAEIEEKAVHKFRFSFRYMFRTLTPVAAAVAMAAILILPQEAEHRQPKQVAAGWSEFSDTKISELHAQLETARYDLEYGTDYVSEFEIKTAEVEGRLPSQDKENKS